jgi:hypothetical protein
MSLRARIWGIGSRVRDVEFRVWDSWFKGLRVRKKSNRV